MVKSDHIVSIQYTLKNAKGDIIDKSTENEPLEYLHGHHVIVPGLEKAMEGHKVGDTFSVVVSPAEGYGEYDSELLYSVSRKELGDGVPRVGMYARLSTDTGMAIARITKVTDEEVVFDANHSLAGEELHFDIEVVGSRKATAEEIANGGVHSHASCGDGSCHGDCSGCH